MKHLPTRAVALGVFCASALAASETPAQAQTLAPPPIQIQSCTVMRAQRSIDNFYATFGPVVSDAPYADGIRIDYINHGAVAADRIAVQVTYGSDTKTIVDIGKFTPNVPIERSLGDFSGERWVGSTPTTCEVRAVRFVDGSVWHALSP
jgi:hypothetical protein